MLKDMKIGRRLGLGFGTVLLLALGVGAMGYWGTSQVAAIAETLIRVDSPLVEHAQRARANTLGLRRYEKDIFLNVTSPEVVTEYYAKWNDERQRLEARLAELEKRLALQGDDVNAGKDKELVKSVRAQASAYESAMARVVARIRDGSIKAPDQANEAIGSAKDQIRRLEQEVYDFANEHSEAMLLKEKWIADREARVVNLMLLLMALAVVIGAVAAVVISRGITGPLAEVVGVAQKIAQGDLTQSVTVTSRDETGQLLQAMSDMLESLSRTIGEVGAGANALAAASGQVSATSQSLSQGTSEQAASVEETSSSLEQMNASITQNAENSRQTEQMAVKGSRDAEESGRTVKETMSAMKEIAEKVSIIEEIAYQTNLLALNAAIEAARAGEHGRGFAVVATEVRKLAERSQTAAKEINSLASTSVSVAERSGRLLDELVPGIRKTADLVQEVAAASREQASGVSQINKAMSQVDQVTQRNASAAEELASTAEEMSSQAESLQQLVAFFKVNGHRGRSLAAATAHAAHPAIHAPAVHPPTARSNGAARRPAQADHEFQRF